MSVHLSGAAADPRAGMTFGELGEFVDQARAAGCLPGHRVKATVTFRGLLKTVSLTDQSGDDRGH